MSENAEVGGAAHVVIVDDDDIIRKLLVGFLSRHDFQVTECADAAQMWAVLAEQGAQVVLLDVEMPGENGLALCRKLRSRSKVVGIIMLTGHDTVVDKVVGLEMGADDYVTKPYDRRELVARVRALMRRVQEAEHLMTKAGVALPVLTEE